MLSIKISFPLETQISGHFRTMATEKATYSHGHHTSVVKHHAKRTAENSAAFLLPHIERHHRILDIGSGPGSITIGFARLASEGHVIGGDIVPEVLKEGEALAKEQNIKNISFQQIDANALPFEDASFDITFCHQVLQHVGDPVGILKEMRRVTKPGGIVAAREADYRAFVWYPEPKELDRWGDVYQGIAKANGAEPNAGRYLRKWAAEAGFGAANVTFSWAPWNFQHEEAKQWGITWADRVRYSSFATSAKKHGMAEDADLESMAQAWLKWSEHEQAFMVVPNGEIICKV
ncbi:hypothetical protein CLAFUW4_12636 [Fulvia fulva]|uniref:Methyltransferase domain-containing protein n=1 Tax=Passalora fulva TaxID=5499 RepID=A0A9Q8UST1_PASFU|nr:uncharacterized protein CLAFUR5_11659 [Fulvia fulva]KAK4617530.1 hypothetical protein CLAFUR4_12641 [Fulvia fulva]KAK4618901.1 hypothetical protein CLAFUR0_12652 [Fulvia fulva]UJO21070.1 hypothetical protein CLAFUR5_11659 [Fulvia fulva]WPV18011.1 hypothetical protein CLAFUW4_12636 [Fulvia fulva]WPV32961.1 hypothetical protein CLAFUW7_12643 [Fulvia fulva]